MCWGLNKKQKNCVDTSINYQQWNKSGQNICRGVSFKAGVGLEKFEAVHCCVTISSEKLCKEFLQKKTGKEGKVVFKSVLHAESKWLMDEKIYMFEVIMKKLSFFKYFYHVFKIKAFEEGERCKVFVACWKYINKKSVAFLQFFNGGFCGTTAE